METLNSTPSGASVEVFPNASNFTVSNSQILAAGHDLYITVNSTDAKSEILQWLKAPNPAINFSAARDAIQPGTGDWLFADARFANWKQNKGLLWLQGKAGSGKTFLSTHIIDVLDKEYSANQPSMLLFHYFDSRAELKQTYQGFLLSLIAQIVMCTSAVPSELENMHRKEKGSVIQDLSVSDLETLLPDLLGARSNIASVYIVLDALDECKEADQLKVVAFIQKLLYLSNMHILITSRHPTPCQELVAVLDLKAENVDPVISNYLDCAIKELSVVKGDLNLTAKIKESLMNGADGQFRWIDCQLTTLRECGTRKAVNKKLRNLPNTLEKTYINELNNIDNDHQDDARLLLQWLTFSFAPLSIKQCQEILAVDLEEWEFNPEDREDKLEHSIYKIIGSVLVTVSATQIVQLAHHSVKEFLSCNYMVKPPVLFQINEQVAHQTITKTCLIYLLHYCKERESSFQDEELHLDIFSLAEYAAEYWYDHGRLLKEMDNETLNQSMSLMEMPLSWHWLKIRQPDRKWAVHEPWLQRSEVQSAIYYAACCELHHVVTELLAAGADVNAQNGEYRNALQAAIANGSDSVVHLLLEAGADVNAQGGYYGNVLQEAAANGSDSVVQLLLTAGADVNAQGGGYGNALQAAAQRGSYSVVQLLLAAGADVNDKGGFYGSALQAAAANGSNSVVQLLLTAGADVNAQGGFYGNSLQAAAANRSDSVVLLLLAAGADVNAQGGEYGDALQAAAQRGSDTVVQLLLEAGADVNAQGGEFGNALQAAAANGSDSVVQILLAAGANVNAQGGLYGNALQVAAENGYNSVMQLLLDAVQI